MAQWQQIMKIDLRLCLNIQCQCGQNYQDLKMRKFFCIFGKSQFFFCKSYSQMRMISLNDAVITTLPPSYLIFMYTLRKIVYIKFWFFKLIDQISLIDYHNQTAVYTFKAPASFDLLQILQSRIDQFTNILRTSISQILRYSLQCTTQINPKSQQFTFYNIISQNPMDDPIMTSHPDLSSCSSCQSLPFDCPASLMCFPSCPHDTPKKIKVQLCRNYVETGYCQYGPRCCFAHGYDELCLNSSIGPKLRTKQCRLFHKELVCKYGARCNFIHLQRRRPAGRVQNYEETMNLLTDYPELLLVRGKRRSILEGIVRFDC